MPHPGAHMPHPGAIYMYFSKYSNIFSSEITWPINHLVSQGQILCEASIGRGNQRMYS